MNATHVPTADDRADRPGTVDADDDTPSRLLGDAADYIQTYGWHQGDLYGPRADAVHPPACALGGIYTAAAGVCASPRALAISTAIFGMRSVVACRVLIEYLVLTDQYGPAADGKGPDTDEGMIEDWNDEPERTIGDVLTALREAADHWDRTHPTPGGAP
jgi:hypothetical protein